MMTENIGHRSAYIKKTKIKTFWNSFPNSEKSYFLNGDTDQTIDFTEYQKAGFSGDFEPQEIVVQEEQHWQEPNLFFKPSSDSDSSEDPDNIPPIPLSKNNHNVRRQLARQLKFKVL
jgi:hypothetical protein